MRYKIILSNTSETITIREEELEKVLNGIKQGSVVIVNEGIFNPSYFVAIVEDRERNQAIFEAKKYGSRFFKEPSPFSKLLVKKYAELPEKLRSEVNTETAEIERNNNKN